MLVASGEMLPVSNEPSLATMRCASPSPFVHTAIWPPTGAGFGANDCAPLFATIVIAAALSVGDMGEELSQPAVASAIKAQPAASDDPLM